MTEGSKAVFLSYAHEDAAATQRIAEALRAAGVEVWFDQSELRGGDAWDANIRAQVETCALFVPVLSAHTQARREGYFRLEWHRADDRTLLMAEGTPFLLPVVIDDTKERGALVPKSFLGVQWTRLPDGETTPAFVQRVQALLGVSSAMEAGRPLASVAPSLSSGAKEARPAQRDSDFAKTSSDKEGIASPEFAKRRRFPLWATAVLGLVVLGLVAYFALRPPAKQTPAPVAAAKPAAETKTAPLAPAGPRNGPKSIAVLPFDNISEDKAANAHFADGMHEDILTNLALIHELYVTSRTTVMKYRDTKKSLREIGEELGVAYVLEGSVRRDAKRVRITGQLIRADTDGHLWAERFDRDLTDVFAIQTEIATAIADKLKAVMLPHEKKLIQRRPTPNPVAYDLYLRQRAMAWGGNRDSEARLELLKRAVQLDPAFAEGWATLGVVLSSRYRTASDHTPANLAATKAAFETAIRLAPDLPEVMLAQANYFRDIDGDLVRSVVAKQQALALYPNNFDAHFSLGKDLVYQRRFAEGLHHLRIAIRLGPENWNSASWLRDLLLAGRRYDEASAELQRAIDFNLTDAPLTWRYMIALNSFRASETTDRVEQFFSRLSEEEASSNWGFAHRLDWATLTGNSTEYLRLTETRRASGSKQASPNLGSGLVAALFRAAQGDLSAARKELGNIASIRSARDRNPDQPGRWSTLARWEALLGNKDEALRCAQKAVELASDALARSTRSQAPQSNVTFAFIYTWTGDKDRAIAEYARLLREPYSFLNVHEMKRHPAYAPLRGDPRFEALLTDPKNNAPLF